MNIIQGVVIFVIGLFVVANLLHPGGWFITLLIIAAILIFYALGKFMPEYMLVTNQGKNAARQDKRRERRSKGLNPLSRKSKQDGAASRQSQSSTTSTNNGGSNNE